MATTNTTASSSLFVPIDVNLGLTAAASVAGSIFLVFLLYPYLFNKDGAIISLGGVQFLNAWVFFNRRFHFVQDGFRKTKQKLYQFRVLQHKIIALSGDEGRKVFFNHRSLSFQQGYQLFLGGVPNLKDINQAPEDEPKEDISPFNKRLAALLRRDRLDSQLLALFSDIKRAADSWGKEGRIDPFDDIYFLVFQFTARMATCRELAEKTDDVKRLRELYWIVEKSTTPKTLLLPWLPSRHTKKKEQATMEIFSMLSGYIEGRKEASDHGEDAIDIMMSMGDDPTHIIKTVIGIIFAGVLNTGKNACWALIYLATSKEWLSKVKNESNALLDKYASGVPSDSIYERFSAIPASAWEGEMPAMDSVIRETLRLVLAGSVAIRRNMDERLSVGDQTVEPGVFMVYPFGDVHLDPSIYPSPDKFDPGRYDVGREEDRKVAQSFLAWGTGRHPCTGMNVAKLEMKIIVAFFVTAFDYTVTNGAGSSPQSFPTPDPNDMQMSKPLGDTLYLKYKKVA